MTQHLHFNFINPSSSPESPKLEHSSTMMKDYERETPFCQQPFSVASKSQLKHRLMSAVIILGLAISFYREAKMVGMHHESERRSMTHVVASQQRKRISEETRIFEQCYKKKRFHGYWDDVTKRMRHFDPLCDESIVALVKDPSMSDSFMQGPVIKNHTSLTLLEKLEGSCILLLGDSTDRQIMERWCPRWGLQKIWMPPDGEQTLEHLHQTARAGHICDVLGNFSIGQYQHYGVGDPP
jgi:hypothetical protein